MSTNDIILIITALIIAASSFTAYLMYRSATDPNVIVYAEVDRRRPSIINLIIKNIGKGPALDATVIPPPNRSALK